MIRAFLFDYGGVITTGGRDTNLSQRLAAGLGIDEPRAWALLSPVWSEYMKGLLDEPALWQKVAAAYGRPIPKNARAIWNLWPDMQPLPEMRRLVQQLRDQRYPVGLLSNTIPNTMHDLRAHGVYDLFDFTVISCEVGHEKPEPEIYQAALKHLPGIPPEDVVFLDDREHCLVPAGRLGMQTILVTDPAQAIRDVEALL